ncbi:hypothetical protein [Palleronia sp. LCG004]|uniref:hypothetical protein n=1 Tax=Palleronia sp. LCG004 TaxID=3079304 RepID=UPI0029431087|nr:hypothetical protein [Palleronia sp. LCG004]WOI56878.1 hypothetical protein RVY76_03525 [Palleronia sp. LCG004]
MLRYACLALGFLTACGPGPRYSDEPIGGPVDYGSGVGFGSYQDYERARSAQESGFPMSGPGSSEPVISSTELSAAGLPTGDARDAAPRFDGTSAAASSAAVDANNPGISDEQSFAAVSARESIESDAERLARQAQAYRVIQPTAVPTRRGSDGPNIVAYALQTSNAVGQPIYRRGGIGAQSRSARACAGYASPDLAQEAFLERGGPERDRLNLDPDGDGFACGWDPTPFRAARG